MNYKCKFCIAELKDEYSDVHVAKHFQRKEFTDAFLRKYFHLFFYKVNREEQQNIEEFGFSA